MGLKVFKTFHVEEYRQELEKTKQVQRTANSNTYAGTLSMVKNASVKFMVECLTQIAYNVDVDLDEKQIESELVNHAATCSVWEVEWEGLDDQYLLEILTDENDQHSPSSEYLKAILKKLTNYLREPNLIALEKVYSHEFDLKFADQVITTSGELEIRGLNYVGLSSHDTKTIRCSLQLAKLYYLLNHEFYNSTFNVIGPPGSLKSIYVWYWVCAQVYSDNQTVLWIQSNVKEYRSVRLSEDGVQLLSETLTLKSLQGMRTQDIVIVDGVMGHNMKIINEVEQWQVNSGQGTIIFIATTYNCLTLAPKSIDFSITAEPEDTCQYACDNLMM